MRWFFLVGFMGTGKTTLGAAAARRLSLPFYDLDRRIETDSGASVREIFESAGEKQFRELETRTLRDIVRNEPAGILALGGGTFVSDEARALARSAGLSVWLDVPVAVLLARVEGAARPLWTTAGEIRRLAAEREAYYRLADLHLELGDDPLERCSERLDRLLAAHCDWTP